MMSWARLAVILSATAALGLGSAARAEEYKIPDGTELATFSPEAQQFYTEGMKSLDRVDYTNAYEHLSKAAALQPNAVRLNLLVAALALKQGRSKSAAEAKNCYETAIACYRNVLLQAGLDHDTRRDVRNREKIAVDERDNLAQRDARREGVGNQFVLTLNREIAKQTPRIKAEPTGVPAAPAAIGQAPAASAVTVTLGTGGPTDASLPQMPPSPNVPPMPTPSGPTLPVPGSPSLPAAQPPPAL